MFMLKAVDYNQYILFINDCPPISFDFSDLTKYARIPLPIDTYNHSNIDNDMV